MNYREIGCVLLICATVSASGLQAQSAPSQIVRTFPLQHMSNSDAAKLVSPYVEATVAELSMGASPGVFEAGHAVHAITVRATAEVMARVDSLLKANDRAPATIAFRLQVIAATDSSVRDLGVGALDAELHNLFRFAGYRLLSQSTALVDDGEPFAVTVRGADGDVLEVSGRILSVQRDVSKGTVRLEISLVRKKHQVEMGAGLGKRTADVQESLLRTGLSVPLGQTAVVGSAMVGGSSLAIILAVRPEIAARP